VKGLEVIPSHGMPDWPGAADTARVVHIGFDLTKIRMDDRLEDINNALR
jgi:hypothetical protein